MPPALTRVAASQDGDSAVVLDGNSVSCPNEDVTKLLKFEADLAVGVGRGPEETVRRGALDLCRSVADGQSSTLLVAGESAAGTRSFVEGDIRNEEPGAECTWHRARPPRARRACGAPRSIPHCALARSAGGVHEFRAGGRSASEAALGPHQLAPCA